MNAKETLEQLRSLGAEQTLKTYRRHGAKGPAFGVSFANFGKLKKKIKVDDALALELWETGNLDARILATMIADPERVSRKRLDTWIKAVEDRLLASALSELTGRCKSALDHVAKWTASPKEFVVATGWNTLSELAKTREDIPDSLLEEYLDVIESKIRTAKNRAKYAMNFALIRIGSRSSKLEKKALAVAKRIGVVEIDHGETGCKTPDAVSSIQKARAKSKSKGPVKKPEKTTHEWASVMPLSRKGLGH